MNGNIRYIVVHYTATYEDQNLNVHDIRKMHLARNMNDIGYHRLILLNGQEQQGRPDHVIGAHCRGFNTNTLGVCYVGGLRRATGPNQGFDTRTPEQTKTLIRILNDLTSKWPKAEVVGHRDLVATQCPGFDVKSWWGSVKGNVSNLIQDSLPIPTDLPVIRRGHTGDIVRHLQKLLVNAGHRIIIDGDFGPNTDRAVRSEQAKYRLVVDGIVGKNTWAALERK